MNHKSLGPQFIEHILAVPILRHHAALLLEQVMTGYRTAVSNFVGSLPAVDISTIPDEDMTCPYCWSRFDEVPDPEDGTDNTPIVATCSSVRPHLFGRSCLIEIMKSAAASPPPLCPLCRQAIEIPEELFDLDYDMIHDDLK